MRRKDIGLLPFVDERIDLGGDELLQDAAGFVVVGGEENFYSILVIPGRSRSERTTMCNCTSEKFASVLITSRFPDVHLHI
jgi:hypothetical protein